MATLLLLTAPAGAETTTIDLIGVDQQNQFTIFLRKTDQTTFDHVFFLKAQVTSDFSWNHCFHGPADLPRCERDLWIAVVSPPVLVQSPVAERHVAFVRMVDGLAFDVTYAGPIQLVLAGLPFETPILPSFRLGFAGQPIYVEPYPTGGFLFALTQFNVNTLPPGQYSIYAFYTTSLSPATRAVDIADLGKRIVSNVAQYDIFIDEGARQCGTQQVAGGDNGDTRLIELGRKSGKFQFDYQTFTQKDRMVVRYEGKTLFETGCVGASSSVTLSYSGNSSQVQVDVFPNCAGGQGTQWNYTVHCAVP